MLINLADLNPAQKLAASTIEGPVLILAGAGSGKTRTITYRMAHMIANLHIPASSILAVSFTNKAAQEMEERVQHLIGKKRLKGIQLGTFHSLGTKILKQELHYLGYHTHFTIYDTSDQLSVLREALNHIKGSKNFDRKRILAKISFLKNKGISAEEFISSPYFDADDEYDVISESAYHFYQEKLKFFNAIDFDDLLFLTVKIFTKNPHVAEKYSRQFQYIMVDEFQDTNPLQFQLIRFLTMTHHNLCVVGDDDQSIYSFRGADITNILEFEKHFPEAKIVKLEQNYRSTTAILDLANAVIKENPQRKDKTMWTDLHDQTLPLLWACGDTDHEAQVVADEIMHMRRQGLKLRDIAILVRSNTQTASLEEALRFHGLPHQIIGGQKFYEKKEIKDLMAYLQVIKNPYDEISLRRILNIPQRGIGITTLNKFIEKAQENKISLFKALEEYFYLDPKREQLILDFVQLIYKQKENFYSTPLHEALRKLISDIEFFPFIEKTYEATIHQVARRKNDVEFFIQSAQRFFNYYHEVLQDRHQDILKNFIERIMLQDSQDRQEKQDKQDKHDKDKSSHHSSAVDQEIDQNDELTILTLHSSKGLEYDTVFLIGMEEELLPHKKSLAEGNVFEERRLCYVGITRARRKLVMTYCKERSLYGKKIPRFKSRFIIPFEEKKLFKEQDKTTFHDLSADEIHNYQTNFFGNLLSSLE